MESYFVAFCYCLLFCADAAPSSGIIPDLPSLKITAVSHFDLGKNIGMKFKDQINTALNNNIFFKETILPYNKTQKGAVIYQQFLKNVQTNMPQYLDEVWGMAAGAGLEFSVLFLWNIQFEMRLLLSPSNVAAACSDLYVVNGTEGTFMGHNEDGSPGDMSTSYLISAEILSLDAQMPLETFTAFCYPGELCGNAFGFNPARELVFTVNALFPKDVNTNSTARNFLNRAVISLPYDTIPNVLRSMRCSSGFSLNIGDLRTQKVSNIEVSPEGEVITEYENGTGYHFNMYLHSDDVEDLGDPSSQHRLERVKDLPPPKDSRDILNILGDTEDKEFPIFRTASATDGADTLATGLFDFSNKKMMIYRGNPSQGTPSITLSMEK